MNMGLILQVVALSMLIVPEPLAHRAVGDGGASIVGHRQDLNKMSAKCDQTIGAG